MDANKKGAGSDIEALRLLADRALYVAHQTNPDFIKRLGESLREGARDAGDNDFDAAVWETAEAIFLGSTTHR